MQNNTGQKIRLRRNVNVNVNKQAVIQQNLSHMEQRAHKKKIAQEYYYNNNKVGQSPLRRGNLNSEHKPPVHNRLGNKIRLTRTANLQTNATAATPQVQLLTNRIRLQRVRQQQPLMRRPTFGLNTDKIVRVYSAQNRLSRISAQNRLARIRQGATFVQRGIVQKGNNLMHRGVVQRMMLQQPGLVNQRIRLRRNRPQPAGGAVNYTVQVSNNAAASAAAKNHKHHVSEQLNPTLQEEIRMIQNKDVSHNVTSNEAVHPVGMGTTAKTLHERFSEL